MEKNNKYMVDKKSSKVYILTSNGKYCPYFFGIGFMNYKSGFPFEATMEYQDLINSGYENINKEDVGHYISILEKDLIKILWGKPSLK